MIIDIDIKSVRKTVHWNYWLVLCKILHVIATRHIYQAQASSRHAGYETGTSALD